MMLGLFNGLFTSYVSSSYVSALPDLLIFNKICTLEGLSFTLKHDLIITEKIVWLPSGGRKREKPWTLFIDGDETFPHFNHKWLNHTFFIFSFFFLLTYMYNTILCAILPWHWFTENWLMLLCFFNTTIDGVANGKILNLLEGHRNVIMDFTFTTKEVYPTVMPFASWNPGNVKRVHGNSSPEELFPL